MVLHVFPEEVNQLVASGFSLIWYSAHVKLRDHVRADVHVGRENLLLLRRRKRNSTVHF